MLRFPEDRPTSTTAAGNARLAARVADKLSSMPGIQGLTSHEVMFPSGRDKKLKVADQPQP